MRINSNDLSEMNNVFSGDVTWSGKQALDEKAFLVHEHTKCGDKYRHEHPDRYVVMTEVELGGGR